MSKPLRIADATVRPLLTVDLAAIASNTRLFADRSAGQLMAVVKADGFGHDATAVAHTALANGASWFGVTSVDEAFALRESGIRAPVLSWLNPVGTDFEEAVRQRIDVAIPTLAHLSALGTAAARVGRPARVHLHIDVGMARDGHEPFSWPDLCRQAHRLVRQNLLRVVGVMGHLGCADDPRDPCNAMARQAFVDAVTVARRYGLRPSLRHLAATSATLTDPRSHFDLCRVGAGLVGIDPTGTTKLRPAMTLTAPVVSVRDAARGTSVGYGHTYLTARDTRLALLPLGYADGIPRAASGRGWVQLRGTRHRIVGLVSMDQIVIDVGSESVQVGDTAIIFGPGDEGEPTTADWARWAVTIEHEIVTGISSRVARRLVFPDRTDTDLVPARVSLPRPRRGVPRLRARASHPGVVA
jgi:alanine racemase